MAAFRRILAVVLVGLLLGFAAVAWVWRVEVVQGGWYAYATRPLSGAQAEALTRCESPGWLGWLRVLGHDVDVDCAPGWVPLTLAEHVSPQRARWLRRLSEHPRLPARQRLRAGLALVVAGEEAPRGLGLLLSDPRVPPAEVGFVLELLADRGDDAAWLDPRHREGLVLGRLLDGDAEATTDTIHILRRRAALTPAGASTGEEALVEAALDAAGFGGGRLDRLMKRHAGGYPLQEIPWPVARHLAPRLEACRDRGSPDCARLAADLLEGEVAEAELEPRPEAPAVAARPLWEVLYGGRADVLEAVARRFQAQAEWIAAAEGDERAGRLLGSIAHPSHGFDADMARAGLTGDPTHALAHRRATPWTSALAAIVLSELSGVQVAVEAAGDGVILQVDGRRVGLGPCGTSLPPEVGGAAWPPRAVAAQATIEAAGAALRRGEDARARELAALAERLDPIGAAGVRLVVDGVRPLPDAPERAVGRLAGGLVRAPAGMELPGAEAERRQRAATWPDGLAAWSEAPTGCPSPLGP